MCQNFYDANVFCSAGSIFLILRLWYEKNNLIIIKSTFRFLIKRSNRTNHLHWRNTTWKFGWTLLIILYRCIMWLLWLNRGVGAETKRDEQSMNIHACRDLRFLLLLITKLSFLFGMNVLGFHRSKLQLYPTRFVFGFINTCPLLREL